MTLILHIHIMPCAVWIFGHIIASILYHNGQCQAWSTVHLLARQAKESKSCNMHTGAHFGLLAGKALLWMPCGCQNGTVLVYLVYTIHKPEESCLCNRRSYIEGIYAAAAVLPSARAFACLESVIHGPIDEYSMQPYEGAHKIKAEPARCLPSQFEKSTAQGYTSAQQNK